MGGNLDDRKSTSGLEFYLDESLITWVSQKKKCVSLSSCEVEFMTATAAAFQGVWLKKVLSQISDDFAGPVTLSIHNKLAIDLARNPVFMVTASTLMCVIILLENMLIAGILSLSMCPLKNRELTS